MLDYLKVIRPINLLMIVFIQWIIKLGLLQPLQVTTALPLSQFTLLTFAVVCIAAAGYIINDLFDISIDQVNKPNQLIISKRISEKAALRFYIALNITGVVIGFYLSNLLEKPILVTLFIISSFLLYIYASSLKSTILIGNLIVSALVAMALLIIIIFDIYPAIAPSINKKQLLSSQIILAYACFAFFINLIREIVKDIEDINGDKNGKRTTLPMVLGRERTVILAFSLGLIALLTLLLYIYKNLFMHQNIALYFVFLIGGSLLLFCIKAWHAKTKKEFRMLSLILKGIMLIGMASIPVYVSKLIT